MSDQVIFTEIVPFNPHGHEFLAAITFDPNDRPERFHIFADRAVNSAVMTHTLASAAAKLKVTEQQLRDALFIRR